MLPNLVRYSLLPILVLIAFGSLSACNRATERTVEMDEAQLARLFSLPETVTISTEEIVSGESGVRVKALSLAQDGVGTLTLTDVSLDIVQTDDLVFQLDALRIASLEGETATGLVTLSARDIALIAPERQFLTALMTFAADIDAGNPPQTGYLQFQQLNAAELSIEAARPDATDLLVALSDISVEASSEEEIGAVKFGRLMISAPELTVWDVSVEGIQKTVLDQILARVFTGEMISDRQSSTIETLPFERVQIAALGNEHVSISNIALDVHTNDAGQFVGFTLPPTETLIRISPGLFQSLRALGVLPEGVLTDADTPIPAQVRAKFRHDPVTGEDSLDDTSISIDGLAEIEFSARMKGVTPIFLFGLGLSDEFRFRVEDMTFISTINDDGWLLHLLRDRGLYRPQLLAVMRAIGGQDLAEEDLQSFARDPGKASIEVTAERFGSLETLLRDLIANQGSADMGLTLTVSASLEPTED